MRWNEPEPLAQGLASLLYFCNGTWFEAGPYGGAGRLASRQGTVGSALAGLAQGIGPVGRAALYSTQGSTAGDGFIYAYPNNLVSTTDPITIAGMYYGPGGTTSRVGVAAVNTSGPTVLGLVRAGNGTVARTGGSFNHAGSLTSSILAAADYTANTPYFVTAAKVPQSTVAPYGAQNGEIFTGTAVNQNAAWTTSCNEVWIGRSTSSTLNGGVILAAVWNRALAIEEQLELYKNPWRLIRPRRGNVYSFPGVGGAAVKYSQTERNIRGLLRGVAR